MGNPNQLTWAKNNMRPIRDHYQKLFARSGWSFAWWVWAEAQVLSYAVGCLLFQLFSMSRRSDLDGLAPFSVFLWINVMGPLLETLMCQMLPIELARFAKASRTWQLLCSVGFFALTHFLYVGIPTGITAGLICGYYFAFAYIRNREISVVRAFLTTAAIHSGINLITFVGFLLHS